MLSNKSSMSSRSEMEIIMKQEIGTQYMNILKMYTIFLENKTSAKDKMLKQNTRGRARHIFDNIMGTEKKAKQGSSVQPYLAGAVGIVKLFFGKKYKMDMKREKKCEAYVSSESKASRKLHFTKNQDFHY